MNTYSLYTKVKIPKIRLVFFRFALFPPKNFILTLSFSHLLVYALRHFLHFTSFLWFQLESLNSYKTIESELYVIVPAISLCLVILCPDVTYKRYSHPALYPSVMWCTAHPKNYTILFHIHLTILSFYFFLYFLYCAFSPFPQLDFIQ